MEVIEGGIGSELLSGPWLLEAGSGKGVEEVSAAVSGGAVAGACSGGMLVGGCFRCFSCCLNL